MPIAYQFLPWVRRGLAVALDADDNLGAAHRSPLAGARTSASSFAGAARGQAIAPLPMQLHGPGDVIGIDTALVVRTDPKPNATQLRAELPRDRRLRPARFPVDADAGQGERDDRLRPWLVLVVLEVAKSGLPKMTARRAAAVRSASRRPMSRANCRTLAESWSWAHAQLVNDATQRADPGRSAEQPEQQHLAAGLPAAAEGAHRLRRLRRAGVRARPLARARPGARRGRRRR